MLPASVGDEGGHHDQEHVRPSKIAIYLLHSKLLHCNVEMVEANAGCQLHLRAAGKTT